MQKLLFLLTCLWSALQIQAQILKVEPPEPEPQDLVTLIYDATEGSGGLKDYEGDIYAHTGLITESSTHEGDWKYVVSGWDQNTDKLKLQRIDENIYRLQFTINDLYQIAGDEEIISLVFVFRNEDGTMTGKAAGNSDIFYYLNSDDHFKPQHPEILDQSLSPHPSWADDATIYEVNVRQYTPEGTFKAFSKHLPRLRSMGVEILWLMPVQPIGEEKRKGALGSYYSIKDYKEINPEFGSEEDFKRLVDECHDMGFKVILDWVANHTAWDHEWIESHPHWYIRDEDGNINSPFDWWDVAELDYDQEAMRKEMMDAMLYWVEDLNIDGFRCDVAGEVPADFWNDVRKTLEERKAVWMLAEDESKLWLMNSAFNANYGWTFHATMNEVAKGEQNASAIYNYFEEVYDRMPDGTYPMQFITNHDENSWHGTISERLGDGHKAFATLSFTVPGIPLIYSGQEAGLDHRLKFFEKDSIDWLEIPYLDLYTSLIRLKKSNPALWNGATGGSMHRIENDKEEDVVTFSREKEGNKLIMVINLSDKKQELKADTYYDQGKYEDHFTGKQYLIKPETGFELNPWEYIVLIQTQKERREFESLEEKEGRLFIKTNDGTLKISPYSNNTVEVEFVSPNHTNPPSYAIAPSSTYSTGEYIETEESIIYSAGDLSLEITKSPFSITYYYEDQELISENEGYFETRDSRGFNFNITESEKLMGGGERVLGMDRRGLRLRLYNKPSYGYETHADLMYYSLPIVISSKKYMLVFDNGADGYLDLGAARENVLEFEATGGRMSYFITASDDWEGLISNYTAVSGRQSMLPRWALGNYASRMGYHSQEEVESTVQKYLEEDIPLDAVVIDVYWFGPDLKGHIGNLEWDKNAWPKPGQMMSSLKEKGVKTILITEPYVIVNTDKYDEVVEKELAGVDESGEPYVFNFYFGNTLLLDIFKEETKEWYWDIYKRYTEDGVDGWWGDLGEPEVHPDDMIHVNGRANEVHNLYGHEWCKLIYKGYERDFPDERPVILMRSGFAGSQRYGILPWSGDVNRTWGGFEPQVEIALSMGMQGLAYMHSDLGGFAGAYKDPELYTRWLQYGVFQPLYRTHAQEEVPAEPVFWDEKTRDIVRKYIKLRYSMLPYNYTLTYINATTGVPMMRPLVYLEDDDELLKNTAEYLWGDAFLVSPVVRQGARTQAVYLPEGYYWIDYWTGKVYEGGKRVEVSLDIETIPVFVKAGSFVPMVEEFQSMKDYSSANLILHYYHHPDVEKGSGIMYEDDGETKHAYLKKAYEILEFSSRSGQGKLSFSIQSTGFDYPGKPSMRKVEFKIHGIEAKPKKLKVDNSSIDVSETMENNADQERSAIYNSASKILTIYFSLDKEVKIELKE